MDHKWYGFDLNLVNKGLMSGNIQTLASTQIAAGGGAPTVISSQLSTADSCDVSSFTVASGSGRLLLFFTLVRDDASSQPSSVTYGAASMTKLAAAICVDSIPRHSLQMWYLLNPDVGTANITGGTSPYYRAGALYINGADNASEGAAFGTPVIMTSANTSTPSVTVSSSTADLVIGAGCFNSTATPTFTSPAVEDLVGSNGDVGTFFLGHSPGQTSVVFDVTLSTSRHCGMFGVNINGA